MVRINIILAQPSRIAKVMGFWVTELIKLTISSVFVRLTLGGYMYGLEVGVHFHELVQLLPVSIVVNHVLFESSKRVQESWLRYKEEIEEEFEEPEIPTRLQQQIIEYLNEDANNNSLRNEPTIGDYITSEEDSTD